jgi:hypothetical protein
MLVFMHRAYARVGEVEVKERSGFFRVFLGCGQWR